MSATTAAVEAVWRIESGRLVAALARITGDFPAAEDLAQDALEVALMQWPRDGNPNHPASWLMATAKHLAADQYRRQLNLTRKLAVLAHQQTTNSSEGGDPMATVDEGLDAYVNDDLLRLMFTACHPVLSTDSQVALTLRTLGGLQTREIARAFLTSETTMGQRISRAKKTLTDQQVRFELPPADELPDRLGAVLGVIYLIFNEGYAATGGDDWTRPALCHDALRLGRVLASLQPDQAEVHGLVALMELQASRIPARSGPDGQPVLLADQDRRRWDPLHISRGLTALERAEQLGGGLYTLQADIAACHATAGSVDDTDWRRIAALYTVLAHIAPSPVVDLNRAVAVGRTDGPERALALVEDLDRRNALPGYPELDAVRATFLRQLGRLGESRAAFERAAATTNNTRTRTLYLQQAEQAEHHDPEGHDPRREGEKLVKFRTTLELSGKTATGLPVPNDVIAALGRGRRPAVRVTIGAYSFHTTIGVMGGRCLIPLSAQHRDAAGLHAGDAVTIELDADDQPQESGVPADLAAGLDQDLEARRFFGSLTTSQRREWIRWIEDAKRTPTRQARIAAAIDALHAGKKSH